MAIADTDKSKMRKNSSTIATIIVLMVLSVYILHSHSILYGGFLRYVGETQGTLLQIRGLGRIKRVPQKAETITCNRSHPNYDICIINGPCLLNPATATFHLLGPKQDTSSSTVEKIRPYPRKAEKQIFKTVKELTLKSSPLGRQCEVKHNLPALVFSAGGYTGNLFHDFIDGFVPLFITVNTIFPDGGEFILVVPDGRNWWISKYLEILGTFSPHKIIVFENNNFTYCFSSAYVGLISHGVMTIDSTQIPNSKSFIDFHNLLDKSFSLSNNNTTISSISKPKKPRIILVSRHGNVGRVILNEKKIHKMLEELGFEVIMFRPSQTTWLPGAYKSIKSSHGMIGVHGAALTHSLFLRPGSVLVQVVPLGLDWMAKVCFENSAKAMGLEYMEYNIELKESSLIEKYEKDHMVLRDPVAFRGLDWNFTKMNVYLKEQDVRLDRVRLRMFMIEAYNKAKEFMNNND